MPRERDSGQALYEEQYGTPTGKRFIVPDQGYDTPILLHPQAFEYYQAGPQLETKHLAWFFDHPGLNGDIRLSVLRLSSGGTYRFGPDRAQIAWTTDAGLRAEDRTYPELTSPTAPATTSLSSPRRAPSRSSSSKSPVSTNPRPHN